MSAENPWKFGTLTRPANPGILELCHATGKKNRRVSEDAEIVSVVCVLPDVLAREDQIFPECLLQSGVNSLRQPGLNGLQLMQRNQEVDLRPGLASGAGDIRFSLNGGFEHARVGNAQHRVTRLDVVSDPEARLGFLVSDQAIVEIHADRGK